MIQELLGGSNVGLISSPSPSPSPNSPSSSAPPPTATNTTTENPRCPRCDSANTKFCYYNNYNLTQPRHFCKTCRRYWTKGGALRNVPIGGGCRKNKSTPITSSMGKSTSATKFKSSVSQDMSKSGLFNGYEHVELPQNPILWATPHNSHLLSLLMPNQNPNPNPNHLQNHDSMKEESLMFGSSHLSSNGGQQNDRALGFESLGPIQVPSIGLSNSFYRNQGIMVGEVQNHGLQELYQRLKSSTNIIGSASSTSASAFLESAAPPVAANHEFGLWNPTLSWTTDLPTSTHGAFP
ncbi:hypothetical protein ACJIZ3_008115 [Penstemon smallii]|uniref:Dof zinc finger protein n=1 Tax=Penstemon smallii TaxID=265156 RepID=A0ABD3T8V1_9LAMI